MSHFEILIWGTLAGLLGGIASHVSWMLKITDDGSISQDGDLRSNNKFRNKIMILNALLGALIGWVAVIGFQSFYGLSPEHHDSLFQIIPIGFFSALFRQDIIQIIKTKF